MKEERKTLERREQMTDLKRLRHSVSHVLACCHSEPTKALRVENGAVRVNPRHGQAGREAELSEALASQISQFMSDERKTPEMRSTMTDLERLRHSASHVLATAILKIWPEAQFAAGPPVENGFYYDVDLPHRISPDDFEKIEAEMKKEIKANHPFERTEVSRDEALELGKKGRLAALGERPEPSKFKLDIIENIPADEKISLYRSGDFIDLCAGPHVKAHWGYRRISPDERRQRLLQRRRKESAVAARLRHGVQNEKRNSTTISPCSRKRRSATIASLARSWSFLYSTTTLGRVCRCFCRAAQSSLKNWRSSRKKLSSPPVISGCALHTSRARACTKRAVISPTTRNRCFRRWSLRDRPELKRRKRLSIGERRLPLRSLPRKKQLGKLRLQRT